MSLCVQTVDAIDAEDGDPDRPQYDGSFHEESLRNGPTGTGPAKLRF